MYVLFRYGIQTFYTAIIITTIVIIVIILAVIIIVIVIMISKQKLTYILKCYCDRNDIPKMMLLKSKNQDAISMSDRYTKFRTINYKYVKGKLYYVLRESFKNSVNRFWRHLNVSKKKIKVSRKPLNRYLTIFLHYAP